MTSALRSRRYVGGNAAAIGRGEIGLCALQHAEVAKGKSNLSARDLFFADMAIPVSEYKQLKNFSINKSVDEEQAVLRGIAECESRVSCDFASVDVDAGYLRVSRHPLRVSVPDWLKQAAAEKLPVYPADTKAVVLADEIEQTIEGPGQYVEHYRRIVKILRPDGREHAQLMVHLRQQDKLLSVHAWSIDSSGHEFEVKEKEFEEVAPHASEVLYSDVRFKACRAPAGEQAGTVIGFEYEVRYVKWLNQVMWVYQENVPVRRTQFTLQLPAGWEYKSAWSGASILKQNDLPTIGGSGQNSDVPAIRR